MSFKDHFSRQAAAYRRYRPAYPPALIEFVAASAPARHLAVDCATGNGQAARALAVRFDAVLAVDASASQLLRAEPHPRVHYAASLAERLPLRDGSVDLVAAAQAAHWFDVDRFHAECRRVLAPGVVVAVWTCGLFRAGGAVDAVIDDFYAHVVGGDWPPERRYVDEGYRTLPFPWREDPAPPFELESDWDLEQVMGYLATWSAVQRCRDRLGRDPLESLQPRLAAAWPRSGAMRLRWPVHVRIGRGW
jgi:SAM-dependent methyltransferase